MTDTTLRCIAGPWCRAAETINDTRHGMITGQPDTLCEHCTDHIAKSCANLLTDYEQLSAALGDRATSTTEFVKTSSTPAIPISAAKEALMVEIVDILELAAAAVSEQLETDQPDAQRKLPKAKNVDGEFIDPQAGSIAAATIADIRPDTIQLIRAWTAIVEPNIDKLAASPEQPIMVWARPKRCDPHTAAIAAAEQELKNARGVTETRTAETNLRKARHTAAHCDDCGGWYAHGQGRDLETTTGLDIAKAIVDVHNRTRAELGKTRLRHKMDLPCPRCGSKVGRDDGTTIVNCENESCRASWTEREFKFLQGLIIEGQETEILKFLLAEAYWRLDFLQEGVDKITDDPLLEQPRSGIYVLQGVAEILDGHLRPEDRKIASDRAEAAARQVEEDNWSWRNESPYRPPRKKRRPKPPYTGPRIKTSSLTTVADTVEPPTTINRSQVCRCNEIHAGDCISEPERIA